MNERNSLEEYKKIGEESIEHQSPNFDTDGPKRTFDRNGIVEWGGKIIADIKWEKENALKKRDQTIVDITEEFPSATVEKYKPAFDTQLNEIEEQRTTLVERTKALIEKIMHSNVVK